MVRQDYKTNATLEYGAVPSECCEKFVESEPVGVSFLALVKTSERSSSSAEEASSPTMGARSSFCSILCF